MKKNIYPVFLDRMTDNYPKACREANSFILSKAEYKKCVIRDLSWLLNSNHYNFFMDDDERREYIKDSVLMYGISSFAGMVITDKVRNSIKEKIITVIKNFEPRLDAETLTVEVLKNELENKAENNYNKLVLEIKGQLWAIPVPEQIAIKTEIDTETGKSCIYEI